MSDASLRLISAFGFFVMIGIAWVFSKNRNRFPWVTVVWGIGLQWALALLLLKTQVGRLFFIGVNDVVNRFLAYTNAGVDFVFGGLAQGSEFSFVIDVLPIILFMGSFMAVLYHLGIVQRVVDVLAWGLSRTMRLSGAESLAGVANVFLGMVEASLVIRPYLPTMTRSELFTVMNLGMATVAGSVLLAYVQILGGGDFAGHLVTASLLSAPAGFLIAKVMVPEMETPESGRGAHADVEQETVNVIDAAATGAINGLRLAAYVGAMLIAFVALIALLNDSLQTVGSWAGLPGLTFQRILGWIMAPVAWIMGIPGQDVVQVGGLLGVKTVLNEFIAYQELGRLASQGALQPRSILIASYALCGFANFGSLAILLGGIGGVAPSRRSDVAQLGLRSILGGSLTTFMTACIAGVLS
jgi:CNT family concentrative nucleoside transporter